MSDSSDDERPTARGSRARKDKGKARADADGVNGEPSTPAAPLKRPFPSRSPSPVINDDNDEHAPTPLDNSIFPFVSRLRPQQDTKFLAGLVPGDEGYVPPATATETTNGDAAISERIAKQESDIRSFGEWWRSRLVSEFGSELGGLSSEPGLTSGRLSLLLSSINSLSELHTSSSDAARIARSVWYQDGRAPVDPLASAEATQTEEWRRAPVAGAGDIEVAMEALADSRSNEEAHVEAVENGAATETPPVEGETVVESPRKSKKKSRTADADADKTAAAKKEKKKKRKSKGGDDSMQLD